MSTDVTLIADPRVLEIPIRECGEPLVDLRGEPALVLDTRRSDPDGLFAHVREGVATRLRTVVATAAPQGHRLLVVEGFRPLELQRTYFERYSVRLAGEHPDWSPEEIWRAATRLVAPPDLDPPHSTGGAVDLTLLDEAGDEVDMGSPMNAGPEDSAGACFTHAPGLSATARAHRSLLIELMTAAGFANYGTEWWHWSYGDRYWAYSRGQPAARYASTHPALAAA